MIKSIKQQYIDLKEGKMTQHNFMRNVRMVLPQYITNVTSFKDSIKILKNKGILNECECDINNINLKEKNLDVDPKELQKGIEVEMEHTDDPVKAEQIALDHLAEDPQYYTKLATIEPEHSGDPTLTGHMAKLAKDLANPFPQYKKLKANNVDLYPGNMGDEMSAPREGKLNEAKDEKGRWTNANGKSMYDQFKEIDNLNGQEVLIGIDYEIEKNHQLTKVEAAKIVIKNLKKNPIYYTSALMSGKEGYEPEYLGGKSANAEARQMQPVKDDNLVDKKMGMQPVKNIEKAKKDADAKKETNKIVKGVEELTFIAKTVRGVQKADPTGEKMKTIRESVDKALAKERLKEMIREEMKEIFDGRANMSYGMLGTKYDETGENK